MSEPHLEYPALYDSANNGSLKAQNRFLRTVRFEYFLLFCVSVASATRGMSGINPLLITLLLVVLAGLFVFKIFKRLDQDWYRCRALAESVKTSTWRFSLRAHPFEDTSSIEIPKANFRNLLRDILQANRHIAANLETSVTEQVTESMIKIRKLPLDQRMNYYVKNRIDEQRRWYSKKSRANRNALAFWVAATIVLYVVAAIFLNAEELGLPWATLAFDPLIVVVTSALGWLQMKRHGELMASYNLTAHEIGIIRGNSEAVKTEEELSDFINEAELAFSREHTQWVARRDAN
ncbi:MAG: hypothetical protein CL814_00070 [Confluentimicrobium sp.]|uniref:DUF4231 domain-containing protein n=1 Tax=Actibacterium sp. TaxID=1872125 RepID=UPI000C35A5BD|nr:DUF4231 domain-containing protein [Actibacterium sp.]MBC55316.1 hypothetical protein [Actibacterium sp.]